MTPAEFEWAQEQTELAFERGVIDEETYRRRMYELGFKDAAKETEIVKLVTENARLRAALKQISEHRIHSDLASQEKRDMANRALESG